MASASRPSRAASEASSSGCEAPSRNEKLEWQCSSAYGTPPSRRSTPSAWNGCRRRLHAGPSPPAFHEGLPGARPSRPGLPESAASSSLHVHDGLLKPTRASIEQKFYERKFENRSRKAPRMPAIPDSARSMAASQPYHATSWLSPSGGAG